MPFALRPYGEMGARRTCSYLEGVCIEGACIEGVRIEGVSIEGVSIQGVVHPGRCASRVGSRSRASMTADKEGNVESRDRFRRRRSLMNDEAGVD